MCLLYFFQFYEGLQRKWEWVRERIFHFLFHSPNDSSNHSWVRTEPKAWSFIQFYMDWRAQSLLSSSTISQAFQHRADSEEMLELQLVPYPTAPHQPHAYRFLWYQLITYPHQRLQEVDNKCILSKKSQTSKILYQNKFVLKIFKCIYFKRLKEGKIIKREDRGRKRTNLKGSKIQDCGVLKPLARNLIQIFHVGRKDTISWIFTAISQSLN